MNKNLKIETFSWVYVYVYGKMQKIDIKLREMLIELFLRKYHNITLKI